MPVTLKEDAAALVIDKSKKPHPRERTPMPVNAAQKLVGVTRREPEEIAAQAAAEEPRRSTPSKPPPPPMASQEKAGKTSKK